MLRNIVFLVFAIAFATDTTLAECPEDWPGDGWCDPVCNNEQNNYDEGDCCGSTCNSTIYSCNHDENVMDCKDPEVLREFHILRNSQYTKRVKYPGYELTMLCDKARGAGYAVHYKYTLTKDVASRKKKTDYTTDPNLPAECQQKKAIQKRSYQRGGGVDCSPRVRSSNDCYDRGHIVTAKHLDSSREAREAAAHITNLLPQSTYLNQRGAWKETEQITECHRDRSRVSRLDIFGGMLYEDDSNDHFLAANGIPTPDFYYKVVVKYFRDGTTPDVIAWIFPNSRSATKEKLDVKYDSNNENKGFLISITELKNRSQDQLPSLPSKYTEKAYAEGKSWDYDKACDNF